MGDGAQPPSLLLGFLFIFSAYLALTETALSCVSRNKIKTASEKGNSKALRTLSILDNFDDAITTLLIFVNITHIAIASIVTVWVTRNWGLGAVSLSTVITTVIVFFFCEMLPKSIAKKQSFKLSLWTSGILKVLMKICKPFSRLLANLSKTFSGKLASEDEVSVTEDEIQDIIEDLAEEGAIDETQSELISSALQFGDVTAEKILTSKQDICAIDSGLSLQEIFEFVRKQTHSRIPVYSGSINNITGVLQVRKYMKAYLADKKLPELKKLTDKVYHASANTEINNLLEEMSKHKVNMAVITDKKGKTLGIVTVEDILEELVGEIWDEDDVIKNSPAKKSHNTGVAR